MGHNWFNTNAWQRINYTLWAPLYDQFVRRVIGVRRRRSLEVAAPQPRQRVLMVGAGTGLDLEYLSPALKLSITAIDLTPAMLRRLQTRARRLGLLVEAKVMDGQALTFSDGSFDLVVLHLILAVIPDPVRCIGEVARVLRPGGRVVILDKFVPDEQRTPWLMRALNPLMRFGGTEITRKLGPILSGVPLRIVHQESAGFHGFMKIVLLERMSDCREIAVDESSRLCRTPGGTDTFRKIDYAVGRLLRFTVFDFLSRSRGSRVAFALFTVLASTILRWLLSPILGYHSGLILFVPAVMAATWYGGLWPGLAAMILGAVVGESAIAQPLAILNWENHEAVRVLLFLLVGLQIAWSIDLLHRRTREAHAANHAKDHFISILSHELRTPLAPALLVAAELAGDPNLPDAVRQQAGLIQRNIALEVRLIDDLLDSSRIRKANCTSNARSWSWSRSCGRRWPRARRSSPPSTCMSAWIPLAAPITSMPIRSGSSRSSGTCCATPSSLPPMAARLP